MKPRNRLIILVILTLIVSLSVAVIANFHISVLDSWFYGKVSNHINPTLTIIMFFITAAGNSMTLICLCLSLFLFKESRKHYAFPVACAVIASALLNLLLKFIFARNRPDILRLIDESYYSFPSGHAMNNIAFYTMVFLLSLKYIKNIGKKYIILGVCIVMPILIGLSRVYLGVHYISDVIAGWLFGVFVSYVVFCIYRKDKIRGKK